MRAERAREYKCHASAVKIAADLGIAEHFTAMVDPSNLASRRPLTEA
jgi:hypothetical protein